MDPYLKLANAIIIQAAKDYRVALRKLRSYADIEHELRLYEKLLAENKIRQEPIKNRQFANLKQIKADIKEIEDFFHSHLYSVLTDADGDYILERLRKEAERHGRR